MGFNRRFWKYTISNYGYTRKVSINIYKSHIFSPSKSDLNSYINKSTTEKLPCIDHLNHIIMPRQLYPGQYTFRIFSNDNEKSKRTNRRADIQRNMANLRQRHQKDQQSSNIISETVMVVMAMKRYCIHKILLTFRLSLLQDKYKNIRDAQDIWPQPLSDPKQLYGNFYDLMHKVSHNIICACCGIIGHNIDEFNMVSTDDKSLIALAVSPDLVPFSFECGVTDLDQHHIMVDPLAVTDQGTISVCRQCHSSLSDGSLPAEALANYRWIGPVPQELEDLTWVEEALIARSHLFGRIFRLEERKNREPSYSSLKGHVVLVPQNTMRLLDILPVSPDSLADIAHVVWVGRSQPEITKLAPQFTVRKSKVIAALKWLCEHHEDYQHVVIDTVELDKWPSVFITEALLSSIARVQSGAAEDAMRDGFATEDVDVKEFEGNIPASVSAIIDVNNTSKPSHLLMLEELQSLQSTLTINVVPGSKILQHYEDPTYFTSAFPTLFPCGTGKHVDNRRQRSLKLKKWIQLLLRHSSRYAPLLLMHWLIII